MPRNNKRRNPEFERRQWPRLDACSVPFLKAVILGQGTEVRPINISRGGLLIETEMRLPPQITVHLKLVTTDGIIKMDGTVQRSCIASLQGVPKYRSAISFEHPFHMLDDLSPENSGADTNTTSEFASAETSKIL